MFSDKQPLWKTKAARYRVNPEGYSLSKIGERDRPQQPLESTTTWHGNGGVQNGERTSSAPPQFKKNLPNATALASETDAYQKRFSRTAMLRQRQDAGKQDLSFDLDGDGVVGQRDLYVASKFDANRDGLLDKKEYSEAMSQFMWSKEGLQPLNPTIKKEAVDAIAPGELPPRTAMQLRRKQEFKTNAVRRLQAKDQEIQQAHQQFAENTPNMYPWSNKEHGSWGHSMALDKICAGYPEAHSFNDHPFDEFPKRPENPEYSTESKTVGAKGYEFNRSESCHPNRHQRAASRNARADRQGDILAMTKVPAPPTFGETFGNIIGRQGPSYRGGSSKDWASATQQQFRASTADLIDPDRPNPYTQAKNGWAGQGLLRANQMRYTQPVFNNGNRLVDNVVGSSKFPSQHYVPYTASAKPLC